MSATFKAPWNPANSTLRLGLVQRIGEVLRGAYAQRGAAKAIARDAEANSRTAESWLYGTSAPRSPELLEMMAANDHLEAQIYALVREIRESKTCPPGISTSTSVCAGPVTTVDRRAPCGSAC